MRALHLALLSLISAGLLTAGCKSDGGGGGTGGQGGGDGGGLLANCPQNFMDDLISDFAADNSLHAADGRQGGWYVYGDEIPTGTFEPPKTNAAYPIDPDVGNPNCSGPGSLRVKATGWTEFGAALGTDFKVPVMDAGVTIKQTYDASKYKGIAFWAKAAAPIRFVQVKFLDPYTDRNSPLNMDDWCIYTSGSAYNCSPYLVKFGHGYEGDAATNVAADFPNYVTTQIGTEWKRFEVLFADTKQDRDNLGQQSPGNMLQVNQLMGMAIQVNADYSTTPASANDFEIWVDDVSFIK